MKKILMICFFIFFFNSCNIKNEEDAKLDEVKKGLKSMIIFQGPFIKFKDVTLIHSKNVINSMPQWYFPAKTYWVNEKDENKKIIIGFSERQKNFFSINFIDPGDYSLFLLESKSHNFDIKRTCRELANFSIQAGEVVYLGKLFLDSYNTDEIKSFDIKYEKDNLAEFMDKNYPTIAKNVKIKEIKISDISKILKNNY